MEHPIRVLLVDSSPLALKALQKVLNGSPEIIVVGTAKHGREALRILPSLTPEVICMAAHLPVMDGPELTREVMSQQACPILILTSEDTNSGLVNEKKDLVSACLQAGAVDVFTMPAVAISPDSLQARLLISKIKILARVRVISRASKRQYVSEQGSTPKTNSDNLVSPVTVITTEEATSRIIAIGASTGGPQVLLTILSALPRNYPYPILCVQHISKGFIAGLVDWLQEQCRVKVKIASSGERLMPGTVYFSEDDHHLELEDKWTIKLSSTPPVDGHRPSVTALFSSVARFHANCAVAVLLTGMGADGAQGMKTVYDAGGVTIVQDKESCVVFGMPAKAMEKGAAQHIMPPAQITRQLMEMVP
jgi:two-component system chemotaxis response regulator CheB